MQVGDKTDEQLDDELRALLQAPDVIDKGGEAMENEQFNAALADVSIAYGENGAAIGPGEVVAGPEAELGDDTEPEEDLDVMAEREAIREREEQMHDEEVELFGGSDADEEGSVAGDPL